MSIEAIQWFVQTGSHLDIADQIAEAIKPLIAERNAIEKAKLAEMRAARWLHPDHTNGQGGYVWTSGSSAGHKAMQTADRLTAEVLGESDE